ncbi:MAG: tRNA (adenosine(37)-N6)-threonylcarbamoyltransferase complex ATPase subunit type 1 TsaE [Proteobacteria bacterium]|nr:tRNA (adenosine(37)-N6)-threonylcarbamoyltransferase complex ATPase subunit type 1 TsaE [Pseudomonadota bacterium]MBU1688236.1 tRNA (adenosine(37)-N6)-threonylcarbamoyltransferase complex ATPase subunit type 1 TsaE [Pseudomonadota bacterium]
MKESAAIIIDLPTLEQTARLGRYLGETARAGEIILLTGPLGAGKTTLAQHIGIGTGVPENCLITSPTFSLLHEYPGRLPLYHMDLYRLSGEEELEELGFTEYMYGNGLTIIEWPDRLGSMLPKEKIEVELHFTGDSSRRATISFHGTRFDQIKQGLDKITTTE